MSVVMQAGEEGRLDVPEVRRGRTELRGCTSVEEKYLVIQHVSSVLTYRAFAVRMSKLSYAYIRVSDIHSEESGGCLGHWARMTSSRHSLSRFRYRHESKNHLSELLLYQ